MPSIVNNVQVGDGAPINWLVVPRLVADGEITLAGRRHVVAGALAYHDHNWGRWYWGDDLGWEWGCFLTPAASATPDSNTAAVSAPIAVVFSLTTDRAHKRTGQASVTVCAGRRRRTFPGLAIRLEYGGTLDAIERRSRCFGRDLLQDRPAAVADVDRAGPNVEDPIVVQIDRTAGVARADVLGGAAETDTAASCGVRRASCAGSVGSSNA